MLCRLQEGVLLGLVSSVCCRDRQERARRKRQQDIDQLWGDILRTLWHRMRLRNEYGGAGAQM